VLLCQTVCHCLNSHVSQSIVQSTSLTAICHAMSRRFVNVYRRFEWSQSHQLLGQSVKEGCTLQQLKYLRQKAAKIWHTCSKWHAETFPWHAAFTAPSIILIYFPLPASLYCELYIYIRFIAKKLRTACSRTSYKIVPLTKLHKYLHYLHHDTSEY